MTESQTTTTGFTSEIADFFASGPNREQILSFRPSPVVQERVRELLHKLHEGHLSSEEQWELDQFEHAEMLMQLVKAKIRSELVSQT